VSSARQYFEDARDARNALQGKILAKRTFDELRIMLVLSAEEKSFHETRKMSIHWTARRGSNLGPAC
jgi:hypothetical protein